MDKFRDLVDTLCGDIIIHTKILHKILSAGQIFVHFGIFDYSADRSYCGFKLGLYIFTAYEYLSGIYMQKSENKLYGRRLSRAVGSDEAENLTAVQFEINIGKYQAAGK